jgi:4-hydroxy-tetrahydrodipicolinate synthase
MGETMYRVGQHSSAIIKGIKCALACLGVCDDFMAEPFHRFRAGERARIERSLMELMAELERLGI